MFYLTNQHRNIASTSVNMIILGFKKSEDRYKYTGLTTFLMEKLRQVSDSKPEYLRYTKIYHNLQKLTWDKRPVNPHIDTTKNLYSLFQVYKKQSISHSLKHLC